MVGMAGSARLVSWENRIPIPIALLVGVMWIVFVPVSLAVEPRTTASSAPWYVWLLAYGFLGSLLLTIIGLCARQRAALVASITGGGIYLAEVLLSPLWANPEYGTWWLGELAIGLVLVAGSGIAWSGTAPSAATRSDRMEPPETRSTPWP
jgi:hypothetical protein